MVYPNRMVSLARAVMGRDLDPTSNGVAQEWIQAKIWPSSSDDGLLEILVAE